MPLRDMDREQMWLLPLIRTTDLCSGFVFRDLSLAVRGRDLLSFSPPIFHGNPVNGAGAS